MDFILLDGDTASFDSAFGDAEVEVEDATLVGNGFGLGDGLAICVEGDEALVVVTGTYKTKTHPLQGTGIVTIKALASDQLASQTTCEGKPVLLVGSKFEAEFTPVVASQQQQPTGAIVPGPTAPYAGRGEFVTRNNWLRGA
jgi:hypothetical protein